MYNVNRKAHYRHNKFPSFRLSLAAQYPSTITSSSKGSSLIHFNNQISLFISICPFLQANRNHPDENRGNRIQCLPFFSILCRSTCAHELNFNLLSKLSLMLLLLLYIFGCYFSVGFPIRSESIINIMV